MLYPLGDWDLGFNPDGYPSDGPYQGTVFKWAAQIGPLAIRRWAHRTEEDHRQSVQARTVQEHERVVTEEDVAIRQHFEENQQGPLL